MYNRRKLLFLTILIASIFLFWLSSQIHSAAGSVPDLASAKDEVYSLIDSGQITAAAEHVNQICSSYSGDPQLPMQLCLIAERYEEADSIGQAKALNTRIAADFPESDYGVYARLQLAKMSIYELIDARNYESAETAIKQMTVDFADNQNLAKRLWEIAHRYDKIATRYDERVAFDYSKALCKKVVDNYPEDEYSTYASLLLAKLKAYELINAGDYESAYSIVTQILEDFAGHEQLPRSLWEIANRYEKFKASGYSKLLCEQIVADYPHDKYARYAALQLAESRVYELIDGGNYEAADSNVSEMLEDFAGHKQLSRRLYEIAEKYSRNEAWPYAEALYGRIAADYPKDKYGLKAKLGVSRTNVLSLIMSQDCNQAEAALDKMVADFNNNPYLAEAVLIIGLQCHDGGLSKENQGLTEQARYRFEKAVEICDRVINEFPDYSFVPEACCRAGDCYYKLGKQEESIQRYQKVIDDYPKYEFAWHAQFMIGYCYEGLKNSGVVEKSAADAQTKAAYEQVIQNYPDCEATEYVRSWLAGGRAEKEK